MAAGQPGIGGAASTSTKRSSASQANCTVHGGPTGSLAGPSRHAAQRDLEIEPLTGDDLATEPGPLDATEQRQLAGVGRVGQHRHSPQLGQCFHHQHPRKGRPSGKVAGEEGLLTGQLPTSRRPTDRARRIAAR